MIDFFRCPDYMIRWHSGAKHRSTTWSMQSDHRAIQLTLPGDNIGKRKKRWTPPARSED